MRALVLVMLCAAVAHAKPRPPVAVVIVIDRSAQTSKAVLEAAKDAVRVAAATLTRDDRIAVVGFDGTADIYVPLLRADEHKAIDILLRKLVLGEPGCDVRPALEQANDLLADVRGMRKHVVVIMANESTYDGVSGAAIALADHGVGITAVGLRRADRSLLSMLSDVGEGRLYMVDDLDAVPKVMLRELRDVFLTK